MSDVAALHAQATRLVLALRTGVERLETLEQQDPGAGGGGYGGSSSSRTHNPPSGAGAAPPAAAAAEALARDLQRKLQELRATSRQLDATWRMAAVRQPLPAGQRDVWARRVESVADECDALAAAVDRYGGRAAARRREAADRAELLGHAEAGRAAREAAGADAEALSSVGRSRRAVADMLDQGAGVLGAMRSSREALKRARRRLLDVANGAGLGESLLRLAERRQRGDAAIVYGGMLAVTAITGLLLWHVWG
jgi:Golgi SNAP receptor complex protein 2